MGELKRRLSGARWIDVANQHVTLKFLGATPVGRLDAVGEVVANAVGRAPSDVRLAGLGAFPSQRRARVLWAGIDDPKGLLASVAGDLGEGFEPLGWRPEQRPFTPHLTLARFRVPARIEDLPDLDLTDLAPFSIDSLRLFRSHLHPRGARYEVVREFPLRR